LVPDQPWEAPFLEGRYSLFIYSVIFDAEESLYKMWYGALYNRTPGVSGTIAEVRSLYATSQDGLVWNKPSLGLIDFQGSRDNNIVLDGGLGSVIKDNPDPNPAHRYKALAGTQAADAFIVYFSPDGVVWTAYAGNPVITSIGGDTVQTFFDPAKKRFVAMLRSVSKIRSIDRRAYAVAYSTDFIHWSNPQWVLASDARDDQFARSEGFAYVDIYSLSIMPYSDMYAALPVMFEHYGLPGDDGSNDGPFDMAIAFSRNLKDWGRPERQPVLARGPAGSFDSGLLLPASQPLVIDNEIWLYYAGLNGVHLSYPRAGYGAIAKWRLDGFAALSNGGFIPGVITTTLTQIVDTELLINADIQGTLSVDIVDSDGNPIPGFSREDSLPMTGNKLDHQAVWDGQDGLRALLNQTVRFRFYIDGGDIYGFRFGSSGGP
jgi:hypothetical protein